MFQDFFSHLYAQQTSPIETLIFTLLSVLVFMALALILYVLVVLLLWKLRFTKVTRVRNLFFPSGEQLREYLGEYGLAVSTALVLATTLQLKHRIVDEEMSQ
jgi:hypothetical protein